MPSGPFGNIAKQMMKEDPKKADAKKEDAKAEPKKDDAKADPKKADAKADPKKADAKKDAPKKDEKKAEAQDPTMPPKVKVTMDDAVIAGLPSNTGLPNSLNKKPAAPAKVVAQTSAKETPAKADAKPEPPKKSGGIEDVVIAGMPSTPYDTDMSKKKAIKGKAVAQTGAKEEPKKADAKAEPKKDDKKADAKDSTMPPKVTVSMDDAVIAGLPAKAGQDSFAKKAAAVETKIAEKKDVAKKEILSKNLDQAAKMAAIMATPEIPADKPKVSLADKKPKSQEEKEEAIAAKEYKRQAKEQKKLKA